MPIKIQPIKVVAFKIKSAEETLLKSLEIRARLLKNLKVKFQKGGCVLTGLV